MTVAPSAFQSGAREDQTLVFGASGAILANVDTAVHLDAEESVRTGLAEEFVAVDDC